jgi:hypothetical protein
VGIRLQAGSGDDLPGGRVNYIAKRIYCGQGCDDQTIPDHLAGGAEAGFHRMVHAEGFSNGRSGAGAHVPLQGRAGGGIQAGLVAHSRIRADIGPAEAQIEQDRSRDDRNPGYAYVEADPALFQVAHNTGRRVESEGRTTGQDHGMDLGDQVHGVHGIGLAGARRAPALVDAAHRSLRAQDHRAAGQGFVILGMPDEKAGDVGNGVMGKGECGRGLGHKGSAGWKAASTGAGRG